LDGAGDLVQALTAWRKLLSRNARSFDQKKSATHAGTRKSDVVLDFNPSILYNAAM
jgi:hypothetical protein